MFGLMAVQRSLHTFRFRFNLLPIVFHDGRALVSVLYDMSSWSSASVHGLKGIGIVPVDTGPIAGGCDFERDGGAMEDLRCGVVVSRGPSVAHLL